MRALLGVLAVSLAAPASAQDLPPWVGVWEGTVGTYPVRACFESFGEGPGRGAYYYLTRLEAISLSEEDGEITWKESAAGSESDAFWQPSEMNGAHVRGTWMQGNRKLPFELTPLAWTEGEWGGPCSSAEFLASRLGGGDVAEEGAELDGWRYTRRTYRPPEHFAEDVSIESFSYPPAEAGDRAINAVLADYLPKETMDDDFAECVAGALSSVGADGFYSVTATPTMASRDYLNVSVDSGNFCGGAHPNYYTYDHTYDRHTGEELDLFDWIGEARTDGEDLTIREALRALVVARWPVDAEAECRDLAADTEYWSLGLAREGLVFRPDFPHVATACEEPVTVEWSALEPFLDDEGKRGLARLRAE